MRFEDAADWGPAEFGDRARAPSEDEEVFVAIRDRCSFDFKVTRLRRVFSIRFFGNSCYCQLVRRVSDGVSHSLRNLSAKYEKVCGNLTCAVFPHWAVVQLVVRLWQVVCGSGKISPSPYTQSAPVSADKHPFSLYYGRGTSGTKGSLQTREARLKNGEEDTAIGRS